MKDLAPTKEEYLGEHPELKPQVDNDEIAINNETNGTEGTSGTEGHRKGKRHEQCGDIVDMIFDVAEKIVEATVGDVSTCGYGLRVATTFLISHGPTLTKVS